MFLWDQFPTLPRPVAAVLQLAVTMDYGIFLIHRFEEERG